MGVLLIEGFDKYGPPSGASTQGNLHATGLAANELAGDWTTLPSLATLAIVAGLSDTGYALTLGSLTFVAGGYLAKTFGSNVTTLVGGFRFSPDLSGAAAFAGIDTGTAQWSLVIQTDGTITLRAGGSTGTIIASGGALIASSVHYIEFQITVGSPGAYSVWLDGALLFSGSGDTMASANAYVTAAGFTTGHMTVDDLYLFDTTGSYCNAPLLTSPVVETILPSSDTATSDFVLGKGAIGFFDQINTNAGANTIAAGRLSLVPITPRENITIDDVRFISGTTSGGAKYKAVLYADSSGSPGALIATGTEVIGVTSATEITLPFASGQALTAATKYWIGFINDTSTSVFIYDAVNNAPLGQQKSNTYGSGAPNPASTMTAQTVTWMFYATYSTDPSKNYLQVSNNPVGFYDVAYNTSSTVGNEDLFNKAGLSVTPQTVYAAGVKAWAKKSDSGTRTLDLRLKHNSTDDHGSISGIGLSTAYQWYGSYWTRDPDGGGAWDKTSIDASVIGYKVAS